MKTPINANIHRIDVPAKHAKHAHEYILGYFRGYVRQHEKHQAERAREAKKVSHVDAEYKAHGTAARHCGICEMFRGPNACTAVRSPISPTAVCKLFELAKKPESILNRKLRTGV